MTQQHRDALKTCAAVHRRAAEAYRLLGGDDDTDDGGNVVSLDRSRRPPVSWRDALGATRVGIQDLEKAIENMKVFKPKPSGITVRHLRSILKDMKAALAAMEALPPWNPPSGGGGRRIAA